MLLWDGVDQPVRRLDFTKCHPDPDILKDIRYLPEKRMDPLESGGQQLMDAILDGPPISHVEYIDLISHLPDALDAPFALFQSRRIPRKVQVD